MTGPGLAGGFGPLRSLDDPALRHNLPSQATSFVGRTAELAELRALVLGGSRLVTIAGPGGIGKSRLALQVAAEALDGDGVWLLARGPGGEPRPGGRAPWPPCCGPARSRDVPCSAPWPTRSAPATCCSSSTTPSTCSARWPS